MLASGKQKSPPCRDGLSHQLSLPVLPDDVLVGLDRLGWAGSHDEVSVAFQDDPDRVRGWLKYWLGRASIVSNAAGAFCKAIRSGRYPPGKQRRYRAYAGVERFLPEAEPAQPDPALSEAGERWQAVLAELQLQMSRDTFDTWLRPTRVLGYSDDTLYVAVENEWIKEWLENQLLATIRRTVTGVVGETAKAWARALG